MELKATLHKILFAVFLLALATWGTSCASSSTTQEETTIQPQTTQRQQTQPQTTQPAAETTPSTAQSSYSAARQIIGTWQTTTLQYDTSPPGTTQVLTFSEDGTLQSSSSDGSPNTNFTGSYSVLDDSHLQITPPNGASYEAEYSLEGDALTITVEDQTATYQRVADGGGPLSSGSGQY